MTGNTWIAIDPGTGEQEEFGSKAAALAWATKAVAGWNGDGGWCEDVESIVVAKVTHRPVKVVTARRADMTGQEWTDAGHEDDWAEVWAFPLTPVGDES